MTMNALSAHPKLYLLVSIAVLTACSSTHTEYASDARLLFVNAGKLYPGGWSGDGEFFYATSHEGDSWKVLEIKLQTGEARELEIDLPGAGVSDTLGNLLLIESVEEGDSEIYLFDVKTTSLERLTDNETNDWHPSFFHKGEKIVFDSFRRNHMDLFVLEIGKSQTEQLTYTTEPEQAGRVSPDGKTLAFHRRVGGNESEYDIVLLNLASAKETIIVSNPGDDGYPFWSPDGNRVLFSSNHKGSFDLYTVCINGAGLTQLTFNAANNKYPRWSRDGQHVVYQSDAGSQFGLHILETPTQPACG